MQCPRCAGAVVKAAARCPHCGEPLVARVAANFTVRPAEPASAGPLRPAHGGPAPLRPPDQYLRPPPPLKPKPPGAGMALASLICSITGVLLLSTCIAAPLGAPPLLVGSVLGYMATKELPFDADRTVRTQAQVGMWVGLAGSAVTVLSVLALAFLMVLGAAGA